MPDRAEDNKELEALDQRVDELLADVEQSAERIDAAIPSPPGEAAADEFESADDVLAQAGEELARDDSSPAGVVGAEAVEPTPGAAAEPVVEQLGDTIEFETADEALAEAAAEIGTPAGMAAPRMVLSQPAEPEPMHEPVATPVAVPVTPDLSAEEFSSPEAINKLDEKLAASAAELSSGAGADDVVDDSEIEAQITAPVAAAAEPAAPVSPPAKAAAAPGASASSQPAAAAPAVVPAVHEPASDPATPTAPKEPAAAKARHPRISVGAAAAMTIRPLAVFTSKLKPGARQTIAYAAVVTLFQAACLWGFLAFKGPPGEPAPTSEPVILRKPGDPPASHETHKPATSGHAAPKKADSHAKADAHAKPAEKKAASKPKAGAKKDEHAAAGGH